MVKLFGIDLAKVVNDAVTEAGGIRAGTLSSVVPGARTGGGLTGGTNPISTGHSFQGFVEDRSRRRKGSLVEEAMSVVTILGASVSPVKVPEVNDEVTLDGVTYQLLELLSRDPASAVYEFRTNS